VAGIAACHNALRHVDPSSSYVRAIVHVGHTANRAAVNSHPQLQLRISFKRFSDFQRALHRRFRTVEEDKSHSITNRKTDEFASRFRGLEVLRASHDLTELPLNLSLLVGKQL